MMSVTPYELTALDEHLAALPSLEVGADGEIWCGDVHVGSLHDPHAMTALPAIVAGVRGLRAALDHLARQVGEAQAIAAGGVLVDRRDGTRERVWPEPGPELVVGEGDRIVGPALGEARRG